MMEGSRDDLRKQLDALKTVRAAIDSSRNAAQSVIEKIGMRVQRPGTALTETKEIISENIAIMKDLLVKREKVLIEQAEAWAGVKTKQLEEQRKVDLGTYPVSSATIE